MKANAIKTSFLSQAVNKADTERTWGINTVFLFHLKCFSNQCRGLTLNWTPKSFLIKIEKEWLKSSYLFFLDLSLCQKKEQIVMKIQISIENTFIRPIHSVEPSKFISSSNKSKSWNYSYLAYYEAKIIVCGLIWLYMFNVAAV